jgi:hypothetical protein
MKTLEEIKIIGKELYNNNYEYISIDRTLSKSKLIIKCQIHGIFKKDMYDHLKRHQGCSLCSKPSKLTQEMFINKSNEIHNNKYDYSISEYKNRTSKIKIKCIEHGIFEQLAGNHLQGQGCNKCCKNIKMTNETFIIKASKVHNNKYIYDNINYVGIKNKINILCKYHGYFEQTPNDHLQGNGCYLCAGLIRNTDDFIKKASIIHNNLYDYSKTEYIGTRDTIKIICKIHGEFEQKPNIHLNGCGCQKCGSSCFSKISLKWLNQIMDDKNIFIQHAGNIGEKKVKINDKLYKFDGYCEKTNTVYEFYGNYFHGNPKLFNKDEFNELIKKTYGELYNETINREQIIKNNNYNVITIWESEFKKDNKL